MPIAHVRYFAVLRELRSPSGEEDVEFNPGETAGGLYHTLFPPRPEGVLPVAFAVNQLYVSASHSLSDGDEVVFLPPVGGG